MNGWVSPARLREFGLLCMNSRNVDFIGRYNPRRLFPLVDNKLKTKLLCEEYGVASPALRFTVTQQHEIKRVARRLEALSGFAIKPAKGSGGKGIWVITGRDGEDYIKASGARVTLAQIQRHLSDTLAGLYSLGGTPDVAIVEDLIEFSPTFAGYSHEGVPDIRIIVFLGFPVMAMLRLATHRSDGKANLHQGAVGVGLSLQSGRCLRAVQFNRAIRLHPDTGKPLNAIKIENWREMLLLAARCYDMTGLGYIGTDLVLDHHRGPQLLELNARPGLSIQIANGTGLLPRLRYIETLSPRTYRTPEARVDHVMRHFADQIP